MRFLLKKAPKGFCYVLWALVAIRLICPVTIESSFSLVPQMDTVLEDVRGELTGEQNAPNQNLQNSTTDVINLQGNIVGNQNVQNSTTDVENPQGSAVGNQNLHNSTTDVENSQGSTVGNQNLQNNITDAEKLQNSTPGSEKSSTSFAGVSYVWLTVVVLLLVYMIASYIYLWKKVQVSAPIGDNVYICDAIRSPFIFGVIRPRIYLPSYVEKEQMSYILAHEKAHMKCLDYLWKPLGFVILSIHWFNPLVWMAYVLMCKDLELACDERVIRNMDFTEKRNYSEVLLACSSPRHYISACPVAFGEISIKERIKKVLLYKKPATWMVGIAIVVCIVFGVCFLTNPKVQTGATTPDTEQESEVEDDTQSDTQMSMKGETETENQEDSNSEDEKDEKQFIYTTAEVPEFQIGLPADTLLSNKSAYKELEGWFMTVDGYDALEKYPYADANDMWLTAGFVTSFEGPYLADLRNYAKGYGVSIKDWDCVMSDQEHYEGLRICTAQADVYTYHIWGSHDELSYDSGYVYYWMIIFDDNTGDKAEGKTNCIFLSQNVFSKADAISIGLRFVPDFVGTDASGDSNTANGASSTLYETSADLNHDGLSDKVQTRSYSDGKMAICVYFQKEDGTYPTTPNYLSRQYSYEQSGNQTVVLTKKDGFDYLLFSKMNEQDEEAEYYYQVLYFAEDGKAKCVAADTVDFLCYPLADIWGAERLRDRTVPALKEAMMPWLENGTILLSFDVKTPSYISTATESYTAEIYYNQIWERRDRENYPAGTTYKVAYTDILQWHKERYPEDTIQADLIYVDADETPELVVQKGACISLYAYRDGRIYTIIGEWGFGAAGNNGYLYLPKKGYIYNENDDFAGSITYYHLWSLDENYQMEFCFEHSLARSCFSDLHRAPDPETIDGKGHYFFGYEEITEEQFDSYLMGYITAEEMRNFSNGEFVYIEADKTADELMSEW